MISYLCHDVIANNDINKQWSFPIDIVVDKVTTSHE